MRKEKLEELKEIISKFRILQMKESKYSHFIKTIGYICTFQDGKAIEREKILKGDKDGSAVIVMPVTSSEEILTVIEPRVFTHSKIGIGFPAGYIEESETAEVAALRELKEETGYVPKVIYEIDQFYQDEGCSSAFNHAFIAFDVEKKFDQSLDPGELVKYMTFTLDELEELEGQGLINGANTKLVLTKAKSFLRR